MEISGILCDNVLVYSYFCGFSRGFVEKIIDFFSTEHAQNDEKVTKIPEIPVNREHLQFLM